MDKNSLARNLKKARVTSEMSQKELAEELGISFKTVSAYETSRALPPATTIAKIAELTNSDISEIMGVKKKEDITKALKEIEAKIAKNQTEVLTRTKIDVFVGVVLLDEKEQIYLIKEEDKHRISMGRWNLPGGSVDDDEGLKEAVKRETKEETGYESEVQSLLGCYLCKKGGASWIYVVFKASMLHNGKSKTDPGVKEGRWFGKKEFMKLDSSRIVHPDMKIVYKIAIRGKGLPTETVKYINYDKQ